MLNARNACVRNDTNLWISSGLFLIGFWFSFSWAAFQRSEYHKGEQMGLRSASVIEELLVYGKQWWVISLIARAFQCPSTPFKYCFLDGPSESPEDAQQPLCQRRQGNMQAPSCTVLSGLHSWSTKQACFLVAVECIDQAGLWSWEKLRACKWLIFCWTRQKSLPLTATTLFSE